MTKTRVKKRTSRKRAVRKTADTLEEAVFRRMKVYESFIKIYHPERYKIMGAGK